MLDKLMTPETRKLMEAFASAGFEIRFVGGCVRDALLGVTPKDVDFATDARPDEMEVVAKANDFGFVPTGIQHGTATLVVDSEPFEVTTLRVDSETDGRHATVEFTRSFEIDAERRDLTFNAMSLDAEGNLYDYFGGQEDLQDNLVRFVGIDILRITEDYLRILRYFRFAARFDAQMEDSTLKVFSKSSVLDGLSKVSVERYWQEMQKLLVAPARVRVVEAMVKSYVARAIGLHRFNPHELERADDAVTALSTMVAVPEVEDFLRYWKLSSEEASKLNFLVQNRDTTKIFNDTLEDWLVDGVPQDWLISLSLLRNRKDHVDHIRLFKIPTFPVRGQDLLDQGMKPGKEIGQKMREMQAVWFESRFKKTKEELLAELV
jgi:tRNA nucleotidyltransferase/poly(A) polymerase